ncbi:MAG: DNA methyltransferase [Deltaproteobacteria bacterium]|nr:DNA methyltransferase [Deltaproteobacteria bacterium]
MSTLISVRHIRKKPQISMHRINEAASDSARARNLTHRLYRYPASMSPMITRALIEKYSNRGDLLLDPFCGGGTSAVEALGLGRKIICSDISPFACFITRAKATPLHNKNIEKFCDWIQKETVILEKYKPQNPIPLEVNGKQYAPLTYSTILKLIRDTENISNANTRRLAKIVVLNVARRSIDGRSKIIPYYLVSNVFKRVSQEVIADIRKCCNGARPDEHYFFERDSLKVINCDAKRLANRLSEFKNKIRLVVTSPPYPGVHVLYNRWQVHGRRETDLPFRLLGYNSSRAASFYTLGTRNSHEASENYQDQMGRVLSSIYELMAPGAVFAQVIAFPKNDGHHITEYERLMKNTGFKPLQPNLMKIQRSVPNRKWYTQIDKNKKQPIEHIFLNRKA